MPLHSPAAPPAAVHAVMTALKSPTATRETRSLRTVQGPVTLVHAHPVHALDPAAPDHLAPGSTHLTGWRFLINDADDVPVASAEVVETADGWAFSHFSEGPFVASTHRALIQAQALPVPFQPRLLSVPGLYMVALWLHTDATPDGTADVLIPLAPAPPGIAAHRPHRATDLLPALTERLTPAPLLAGSA
jgi:hypothetical protein